MNKIKIDSGIPLAPIGRNVSSFSHKLRETLASMRRGQSFALPTGASSGTISQVYQQAKDLDLKVAVRKVGVNKFRVWRTS